MQSMREIEYISTVSVRDCIFCFKIALEAETVMEMQTCQCKRVAFQW